MANNQQDMALAAAERERTIVRTSVVGIATNVLLAAFKAAVGLASNSIAVTLDAVNNLSDALSSVITIIGAKLGAKLPDKRHPMGYGRIEYLSSMLVAAIVLYAGITALVESAKKVVRPEPVDYGVVSLAIIAVGIVVKLALGGYVKRQGEKVNSGALIASGSDASFDAILSASVLASALVYLLWGISLEAYVGVVIAVFIIRAGIEMMSETVDDIIGARGAARRLPADRRHPDGRGRLFVQHFRRRGGRDAQRRPTVGDGPRLGAADARVLRGRRSQDDALRRRGKLRRRPPRGRADAPARGAGALPGLRAQHRAGCGRRRLRATRVRDADKGQLCRTIPGMVRHSQYGTRRPER